MRKVFRYDKNVWLPSAWQHPLVSFNFDKIGPTITTLILVAAITIWLGFAYLLGKFNSTEWLLFIAITVWLSGLSLSIFPNVKSQRNTLVSVLFPPIVITFVISYLPSGDKFFHIGLMLSLFAFFNYLYDWVEKLFKEFKNESTLIFISTISLFLTFLSQVFLLIPSSTSQIIFEWFPYFPMAVLFWSSEPFIWVRLGGLIVIFLITFSYAVIQVVKEGAMFPYEQSKFSRAQSIASGGLVAAIANSFVSAFNNTLIPIGEVTYFAIKVAFLYIFYTILRFFEALFFKTLTHSLAVLYFFVRFLVLPMAIAALIAFLIYFTTKNFFLYIHNPNLTKLVFLFSYFGAMILVPFCFLLTYSFDELMKVSKKFYEIMVLPHVWALLLLGFNTGILVTTNIWPYKFLLMSCVSMLLWVIGVIVFIMNIRNEST